MATIHIDGKEYEVEGAKNLLEACLSLGLDIPYFCWHPALGSVGACRQCAVVQYKDENDTRGRLVMSCMIPATDKIYISIEDEEAKKFRKTIIEFLMINHPHDCPVCEEGGNCHLQDMTVMTGHSYRRYRFNKRTHANQDLGPFIGHEMNRCIACYRCVRYYKDYADGTDFGVYGSHDNVYFGRVDNGTLENEFSGNLVEVCPTGVFTDKTHSERYNRKWDMQFAPSICQQCSVGCNISPGERYGELRRIENRYNGSVNHYFLCDRGRFGYGYANLKNRPRQPRSLLQNNSWTVWNAEQTVQKITELLKCSQRTVGVGSARASLESNYALLKLVGKENYSVGIEKTELENLQLMLDFLKRGGIYTPSLREIEQYDAVIILGEDVTQTGARIALAVRQALKNKAVALAAANKIADWQIAAVQTLGQGAHYPLFTTSVDETRLDEFASWSYHAPAQEQARLGFAIANAIDSTSPSVEGLSSEISEKVALIARALKEAKKPLIITGSQSGSDSIIKAAANIALALKKSGSETGISFVTAEANSIGCAMLGGLSMDAVLYQIECGMIDTLIVMENELYRHASETRLDSALSQLKNLIVVDHQQTKTMQQAKFIVSSASFAEGNGTLINQEGRAQRFFKVYDPAFYDKHPFDEHGHLIRSQEHTANQSIIFESWRWMAMFENAIIGNSGGSQTFDEIVARCASDFPALKEITLAAPHAEFRIRGMKLAREPNRYSGRTSMNADISVHEQRQPQDEDSPFTFSMDGYSSSNIEHQQIPFAWAPGWNSPQAWNKFQSEVGGSLKGGDPGVRLFEPDEQTLNYFIDIPDSYVTGEYHVAPYYHLFGSEELSQYSKVIQERMPKPYVMLSSVDAEKLNIFVGNSASFLCDGILFKLPVQISTQLSPGQIGLPLGLPGISPILNGKKVEHLQGVTA